MTETATRVPAPVKLVQIVASLNTGGLEYVAINLIKGLDRTRFEPVVCCLDEAGSLASELETLGVPIHVLGGGPKLGRIQRLAAWLRRSRVRLIHSHNHLPLLYGTLAGRLARVPAIINTKHGAFVFSYMRYLSRLTDRIVSVSEDGRRVNIEQEGAPAAKTLVIPNGIEVERFHQPGLRAAKRAELGLEPQDRVLGMVGRLSAHKDHACLLRALAVMAKDGGKPVKLLVVGAGELEGGLKALAASLGISDQTMFLGDRRDVPGLLAAMDVFVLASRTEGIPLTILEAMAAGLPVVASEVGGNPEVVAAGRTGLLTPQGDEQALAGALLDLLDDPQKAAQMGSMGFERVNHHFSLQAMADAYQDLYTRLLASKGVGI